MQCVRVAPYAVPFTVFISNLPLCVEQTDVFGSIYTVRHARDTFETKKTIPVRSVIFSHELRETELKSNPCVKGLSGGKE